ncbi:helix-turn-helix domain-containing protein [Aliiroseovarius sp. KMU-50]|uniref:Helix-turn-helix domain-containing protein n=1 Tax=Aliiroseovarius salicola TaxID=3009082 RepID=A0ABT4VZ66_9RHOB|nr:helix-turn-helix domain-containing protein [Aliiroseovarius sp. KMU-50]MDA5092867.1 helix-turn-helix domain-containing protein [Aliiroseovarius sp. KMU-50]
MTDPANSKTVHVDILVSEDFVLTEMTAVVEVLRLANRVTASNIFDWTYRSRIPGQVSCRAQASITADLIPDRPAADYLFVLGNSNADHPGLSVQPVIKSYMWQGARVVLLAEAASRYIAETGEQGKGHTTHWENRAVLNERGTPGQGSYALAADDGRLITSAGMAATYDLILSLIGRHVSAAAVTTVSDILLHENIRAMSSLQPFGGKELSVTGNRALDQCIELMQANLDEPLRISELVGLLGISERSLERHFKAHFNITPNAYYRELRLNHANTLLINTRMCVRDVGLACGFPNGFSSLFHRHFGVTPTAWRKQGDGMRSFS